MQVQQRKPKLVCAEKSAAREAGQEGAAARELDWPEDEEALQGQPAMPRKKMMLAAAAAAEKRWVSVVNVVLVAFVMTAPPLVVVLGGRGGSSAVWIAAAKAQLRRGSDDVSSFPFATDKLLGGLLPKGFDERSCRSRYESSTYRRNPGRHPSPYLVEKLRRHEELQRRCGPGTDAYDRAGQRLGAGESAGSPQCKYVVSISHSGRGLGNHVLSVASAFLYAVLTGRALLVDWSDEMDGFFCEPFPGATWRLPRGFPLAGYANFSANTAESYGNMLRNKVLTPDELQRLPAFAYLHLDHDYGDDDKMFFCDGDQRLLSRIPWLVMRTDTYLVPGLFLVAAFRGELGLLFPERAAVFHHLGRYLFHPTNHVWGLVSRYYRAYLAGADERVGIQVRVFEREAARSPHVLEQITSCVWKEKLLPEVLPVDAEPDGQTPATASGGGKRKHRAVLIASLRPWFYERVRAAYWERATASGEDVSVHQPSHDEYQRFGERGHGARAWAEMYLLSLCDVLVTSGWSTFGYVAQGLAGVTPWVMYRPVNLTAVPDPPCGRDVSMEPCFHNPPSYDGCRLKPGEDTASMAPHVRRCEDVSWGLKLADDDPKN